MKLDPPLANLIARCQTICVAECCGINAYDFSPIHIASYLTMYRGQVDESETHAVRAQIETIRANYGTAGASGRGTTIDDMNQVFTAGQIEALATELLANLNVALRLIVQSNDMRYKNAEPTA